MRKERPARKTSMLFFGQQDENGILGQTLFAMLVELNLKDGRSKLSHTNTYKQNYVEVDRRVCHSGKWCFCLSGSPDGNREEKAEKRKRGLMSPFCFSGEFGEGNAQHCQGVGVLLSLHPYPRFLGPWWHAASRWQQRYAPNKAV